MRAHVIQGGKVANTIEIAALDALPGVTLIDASLYGGTIGDDWDGEQIAPAAPDLAMLKASKNAEINAARLAANFGSFGYSGKTFATDQLSRSDIDGINGYVALYNALPAGWPGAWKAVDNSFLPIADVAAWKAFYAAMVAAGNANFAKSQTLKAALQAASTPEAVAAVVWA